MKKEQLSELYLFIIKLIITTIFIFLLISIVLLSTRSHINSRLDKFESRINVTISNFEKSYKNSINDLKNSLKNEVNVRKIISKLANQDLTEEKNLVLKEDISKIKDNIKFLFND